MTPGSTGIDGSELLPKDDLPDRKATNAIVAAYASLMSQPHGKAWIVATAALTNVALLFAMYPDLVDHIKGLSIMGGAIGGGFSNAPMGHVKGEGERIGNTTAWAEFNIYVRIRKTFRSYDSNLKPLIIPSVTPKLLEQYSRIRFSPPRQP